MNKKSVWFLIAVVTLTYANSLFNDFSGDDRYFLAQSGFYRTWKNFPQLFQKGIVSSPEKINYDYDASASSTAYSYRPAVMASFFPEYSLWGLNPLGYHLTGLILHVVNSVLMLWLVWLLTAHGRVAWCSALLFGLHPVNAEAICHIGYRSDLMEFLFGVGSFLAFLKYERLTTRGKMGWYIGSLILFFLALFSKETAIVLPLLLGLRHRLVCGLSYRDIYERYKGVYLGFILVAGFYLYVYMFVFPSQIIGQSGLYNGGLGAHVLTMMQIFGRYVWALLWPFSVDPLPFAYTPTILPLWKAENLVFGGCFVLWAGLWCYLLVGRRQISGVMKFFSWWFLLGMLPASNIFPLPNPMGFRYLYGPSAGFWVVMVMGFVEFWPRGCSVGLKNFAAGAMIASCVFLSILQTFLWKNDFMVMTAILQNFPDSARARSLLAMELARGGMFKEANIEMNKALKIEPDNPVFYFLLGNISVQDPARAEENFKKALAIAPHFKRARTELCRAYANQADYGRAVQCFEDVIHDGDLRSQTRKDYLRASQLAGQPQRTGDPEEDNP